MPTQGFRTKGDASPIYTVETVPTQIWFRPAETSVENTEYGLVKTTYIPAVCYKDVKAGDCFGTTLERQYKVVSVNEIPMSDGQRQMELKKL